MNAAHRALRDATAYAHEAVDAVFSGFDLGDRDSYATFLCTHAEAMIPIEAALDAAGAEVVVADWRARKRGDLILADLENLGNILPPVRAELVEAPPSVREPSETGANGRCGANGEAWIAGTLYVLEGSRLGGKMLARRVPATFPRSYLDADQPPGNWRKLLDRIDAILYEPVRLTAAIAAAEEAFAAFERSGTRWLKEVPCPIPTSK